MPSLEREFLHGFGALEAGEARRANALIADAFADVIVDDALAGLSSEALDVLLAWAELGAFAALGGRWGAALSASDVNGRTRAAVELGRRF